MDITLGVHRGWLYGGWLYGGLAILWRKSLCECKLVDMNDKRMMAIELNSDGKALVLLNVYLPCDSHENLYLGRSSNHSVIQRD